MIPGSRAALVAGLIAEATPGPFGGSTLAVLGVGGIGKSTLLSAVVDAIQAQGVRVVRSRATELTKHEAFAAVEGLISGHSPDMVSAALATVDEWCSEAPLVVWVDDAHHLDTASSRVLSRIARVSRDLPLTLLLSARPFPRSPDFERLLELCSSRIDLGPLTHFELVELVTEELGGVPGSQLLAAVGVAGGNPFAVGVVLDVLEHRGALIREGSDVEIGGGASEVPESAAAAVRSLLARVPDETREVLSVVAVLGSPALPEDVSALSERPLVSLAAVLGYAVDAGMLAWDAGGVVFTHDLFSDTLQEDLPLAVRAALHRKAVAVLQARNAPGHKVAEHAWRGGAESDAGLVRSVAAGINAYAPGVAADLLGQVQPLIAAEETDEMVADRADSLIRAGRGRDAEDLIRAHLPRATSAVQRGRLYRLALSSMAHRTNAPAVNALIDSLLVLVPNPSQARLELLALRSWMLMLDGHLLAAAEMAQQLDVLEDTLHEFDPSLDPLRVPGERHVAPVREVLAWLHGRPDQALRINRKSGAAEPSQIAQHSGPAFPPLYLLYAEGAGPAESANAEARRVSAVGNFDYVTSLHDFVLGNICFIAGRWDDAQAALEAGLEIGEETGSMDLAGSLGLGALMDAHRGRMPEAHRRLHSVAKHKYPIRMGRDFAGLAAACLSEAEAVSSISASAPRRDWAPIFAPVRSAVRSLWAEAASREGELWMMTIAGYVARMGDHELRREVIAALREFDTGVVPVLDPVRAQLIAMDSGDYEAVAVAAELFTGVGHPLAAGFAWEEAGLLAARSGASGPAAKALRSAMLVYDGLGANSDQVRLRMRAQRLGIRAAHPRTQRKAKTGWEALTPTENRVADLVREGLTNPEIARRLFLSPRTVQTHVSHILQKTQLGSRVEIAAARA